MNQNRINKFFGCGCDSAIANTLEMAGHSLLKRRKFLQLSGATAGLLSITNAVSAENKNTSQQQVISQNIGNADTIYYNGSIVR